MVGMAGAGGASFSSSSSSSAAAASGASGGSLQYATNLFDGRSGAVAGSRGAAAAPLGGAGTAGGRPAPTIPLSRAAATIPLSLNPTYSAGGGMSLPSDPSAMPPGPPALLSGVVSFSVADAAAATGDSDATANTGGTGGRQPAISLVGGLSIGAETVAYGHESDGPGGGAAVSGRKRAAHLMSGGSIAGGSTSLNGPQFAAAVEAGGGSSTLPLPLPPSHPPFLATSSVASTAAAQANRATQLKREISTPDVGEFLRGLVDHDLAVGLNGTLAPPQQPEATGAGDAAAAPKHEGPAAKRFKAA